MSVRDGKVVENKKYILEAPDGGWGYMICLAVIIIYVACTSFIMCFGLMYTEFLIELGVGSTGITLMGGINGISVAIGGYLTSPLLKVMSARLLTFCACLCYNCGTGFLVITHSVLPFYICQSMLQGLGLGMLFNLTFSVVNQYFVKRRLLAMSVIQTLTAIVALFAPQFVDVTMRMYGYRGMLLFVAGVSLHLFVATALMQPVALHMKRIEKPLEKELQVLMLEKDNDPGTPVIELTDKSPEEEKSLHSITLKAKDGDKSKLITFLKKLVDLPTMKLVMVSIPIWACSISLFTDFTIATMLPQALYAREWQESDVALAVSLAGFGDLASRILFILFSVPLSKITSQELYIFGLLISLISKLGLILARNRILSLISITLLGVPRCFTALVTPLVIAEITGPDKFTMAIGIYLMFTGILNLSFGPIVGAIRDFTDSYSIAFWLMTGMIIVLLTLRIIQAICTRKRRKNKLNKESSI